jgi:ferrochelatase
MPKRAVLLVNLGSPDSTRTSDVRRYLREFLGDERVLDVPAPLRWLLLEGVILPRRPKKSAHAYERIWTEQGSPLIVTSHAVRQKLAAELGSDIPVYLAMRYGNPSIGSVIDQMVRDGVEDVLLFPQYPHYAMSSWETVVVKVFAEAARRAPKLRLTCIQPFYRDDDYIDAMVESARTSLALPHDHVLFSFHGIPVSHLRKADSSHAHCTIVNDCCNTCSPAHATCYRAQCVKTTQAFVLRAGIAPGRYSISYQSRLAGEPWLTPYTDFELVRLPKAGIKKLLIITPAFVADCLETLEEIRMAGRDTFLGAGGETFHHIPCLNDHPAYISFLHGRVRSWLEGAETTRSLPPSRAVR